MSGMGKDFGQFGASRITSVDNGQRRAAALTCAERASSKEELLMLLESLGLTGNADESGDWF